MDVSYVRTVGIVEVMCTALDIVFAIFQDNVHMLVVLIFRGQKTEECSVHADRHWVT